MTWARHYQETWQSRAGDPKLPHWLRVAAAAYGAHGENGHATFKRGLLAVIVGEPGRPYANLSRAIADAVEYGWLVEGSFWGCLIVPPAAIKKGSLGRFPPCPVHRKREERTAESLTQRGVRVISSTLSERFEPRSPHSVSDSALNPLCSDLSVPHHKAAGGFT